MSSAPCSEHWASGRTSSRERWCAAQVDLIEGLTWTVPCGDGIIVTAAQLQHRLPCWGYVFREAGQPPLPDPAKLEASGASEVSASLAVACCALA